MNIRISKIALAAALLALGGCTTMPDATNPRIERTTKVATASAMILSPADGAVVTSPVKVIFGLDGMSVAPAGMDLENTGHHHLIIDAPLPDLSLPVPANDNYIHFGGAQTETLLELTPGKHTLQLLMGNFVHIPHDPPVTSETITITVK